MLCSVFFVLITIFLYPETSGAMKYISRFSVIGSFGLCFVTRKMKIPREYLTWAIVLTLLFGINVFFANNHNAALSTYLLFIQALWISFCVAIWLIHSRYFKIVFISIIVLVLLYCLRLYAYIGKINWGNRKLGLMLGTNVNAIGMRLALSD